MKDKYSESSYKGIKAFLDALDKLNAPEDVEINCKQYTYPKKSFTLTCTWDCEECNKE